MNSLVPLLFISAAIAILIAIIYAAITIIIGHVARHPFYIHVVMYSFTLA